MNDQALLQIAIDGPAGAGKSTIAKQVAARLGILYLDTGAMYRAVGYLALSQDVKPKDPVAVARLIDTLSMDVRFEDGRQRVFMDGQDVSDKIRTPQVSLAASDVSAHPVVRYKLVDMQREIASRRSLVLDGRDIGTFVLPKAKHKFFLTASVDERARRRLKELQEGGDRQATLADVRREMEMRDQQDAGREVAPLRQAEDAELIDTTTLSIEQVVDCVIARIREATDS